MDAPLAVGTSATVGDWVVRVVSVTADGTDLVMTENEFNTPPDEGEQFFIAEIEATYQGDESSTFWVDMSLKPVGASNVAYESFEAHCGVIANPINDAGETFPGGTITGNACWKINATDADSLVLIAEETFTLDDTRVLFALTSAGS